MTLETFSQIDFLYSKCPRQRVSNLCQQEWNKWELSTWWWKLIKTKGAWSICINSYMCVFNQCVKKKKEAFLISEFQAMSSWLCCFDPLVVHYGGSEWKRRLAHLVTAKNKGEISGYQCFLKGIPPGTYTLLLGHTSQMFHCLPMTIWTNQPSNIWASEEIP